MDKSDTEKAQAIWQSQFITARDGLKLHIRQIGDRASPLLPVICLAGLSRSSLDFEEIGTRIAAQDGRLVLALDYRGRGLSDYDAQWQHYDLGVELADILHILQQMNISRAIFLGTSRGGLLTIFMALTQPHMVAGAILNDIGPVIEADGLARIRSYIGKIPTPTDHVSGATQLKSMFSTQFPRLDDAGWLRFAQRSWKREGDHLAPNYDIRLMKTLEAYSADTPMPDLWPQFSALSATPLLVIRGMLSDLLSQETAQAMVAEHPHAQLHLVPDEGHAPLLEDAPTIEAILDFVARLDGHEIKDQGMDNV